MQAFSIIALAASQLLMRASFHSLAVLLAVLPTFMLMLKLKKTQFAISSRPNTYFPSYLTHGFTQFSVFAFDLVPDYASSLSCIFQANGLPIT